MPHILLSFIFLILSFSTLSSYALDPTVMGPRPEENYGCHDVIRDGQTMTMCYKGPLVPTTHEKLQGTQWTIVSIDGSAITSSGTLAFMGTGIQMNLCNHISGNYFVISHTLIVRQLLSTRMYCMTDAMQVEDAMKSANRSHITLMGDTLLLRTISGKNIIWKQQQHFYQ